MPHLPNVFPGSLRPRLFIASGSSSIGFAQALRDSLATVLEAEVWTDGSFFAGTMTLNALHSIVRKNEFAVCVLGGPGDNNHNVLIELGMFLSVNGSGRTFLVLWGASHNAPSDMAGVTYIRIPATVISEHEAAAIAFKQIREAIAKLWTDTGIYGHGTSWHDSFLHVDKSVVVRQPCGDDNRVHYTLPEVIIMKTDGFVTFRASFEMHNYVAPVKGVFFGRGSMHRDIAHLHYTGRDPELNVEFHGTMVAFLPDIAPVWGLFLSRDETLQVGLNVGLGGFRIQRRGFATAR
jgi:hypothetical protein